MAKGQASNGNNSAVRVELMPLDWIEGADRNPKRHDLDALIDSLATFGFVAPAIVNEATGRLVVGHGRVAAARAMRDAKQAPPERVGVRKDGEWCVPVLRGVTFASEREAERYLLADNRLTEIGGWDLPSLTDVLREMGDEAYGLGWSMDEVDALIGDIDALSMPQQSIPEAHKAQFVHAAIKQIVLLYPAEQFDGVVRMLDFVAKSEGLPSHTDAVHFLLTDYLERRGATL